MMVVDNNGNTIGSVQQIFGSPGSKAAVISRCRSPRQRSDHWTDEWEISDDRAA